MKETDRFRNLKLLGRGGMGMVYRALDTRRNESVALKVVRDDHLKDSKIIRRFEREFKSLAEIDHPNVIRTYEVGKFDDRSFYSMEYVEGQSIEELLVDGPLEAKRAVQLAIDICDGLAAVHEIGLCHRDITPSNVMVTTRGFAKLMDFGLVKPVEETVTQLTETGHIVGTFVYLPPELLLGKHGDFRSDIYQVAVTLYEMLMGKAPFTPEEVLLVARGRPLPEPKPFCGISKGADARLAAILWKAMSFNPDNRYISAAAMGTALKNWMAGDYQSEVLIKPELEVQHSRVKYFVLITFLAVLFCSRFFPASAIEHEVRDIKVETLGARTVVVSWSSSWLDRRPQIGLFRPNESFVEGTLGRCTTRKGKDLYHYRAILSNLVPQSRYTVKIRKPDGDYSLASNFQTLRKIPFTHNFSSRLNEDGQLIVVVQGNLPFLLEVSNKPLAIDPEVKAQAIGFYRNWTMTYVLAELDEGEFSIRFTTIDGERKELSTTAARLIGQQMRKVWQSFLSSHITGRFHRFFSNDDTRVNPLFHEWAIRRAKSKNARNVTVSFWQKIEKELVDRAKWYRHFQSFALGLPKLKYVQRINRKLGCAISQALLPLELIDGTANWFGMASNKKWSSFFAQKPYDLRYGKRSEGPGDYTLPLQWQSDEGVPWTILVDGVHPTAKTFVPPSASHWRKAQYFTAQLTRVDLAKYAEVEIELQFRAVYAGMIPVVDINSGFTATFPPTAKDIDAVQDFLNRTGAHTKMGLMMLNDPFASTEGTKEAVGGMDALMPKKVMIYRHVIPIDCLNKDNVSARLRLFVGPVDEVRPVALKSMQLRFYR